MSDKLVQKYFENMPYGEDTKSSEIHGPKNQDVINTFITSLVRNYDQAMADNDKETAGKFYRAVTRIKNQLDNLKDIKSEFDELTGTKGSSYVPLPVLGHEELKNSPIELVT